MGYRSSYVLVTPVCDDAGVLEDLVVTICGQEQRPDLWVLVDDASGDDTRARIQQLGERHPWIHGVTLPRAPGAPPRRRSELVTTGFSKALEWAEAERLETLFLVNLDPDLRCAPHVLAQLVDRCQRDRSVGMSSCLIAEMTDDGRVQRHRDVVDGLPRGELRIWRRACLDEVGMRPGPCWAQTTALRARNRGWRTPVFEDLMVEAAPRGVVRDPWRRFRHDGAEGWEVGVHPLVMAQQAVSASVHDRDLRGVAMLAGYVEAAISGRRRSHDPELREYFGEDLLRVQARTLLSQVPVVGRRFRRRR